jgi:hypothetical protein
MDNRPVWSAQQTKLRQREVKGFAASAIDRVGRLIGHLVRISPAISKQSGTLVTWRTRC